MDANGYKKRGFTETAAVTKAIGDAALVDMKRSKAEKKKNESPMAKSSSSYDDYPYGLRIDLNEEAMDKLGIDLPKVGSSVTITATAKIESAEERQSSSDGGKKRRSCCLQITKMKVS